MNVQYFLIICAKEKDMDVKKTDNSSFTYMDKMCSTENMFCFSPQMLFKSFFVLINI
jgi:hypothetical protein